jgi:SAM-dependent methyltransferase
MGLISLRPEGFTFVDIGCGKGKVLLSAIVLPFKRVVGVEYSAYLTRIAEQNIASARLLRRRCSCVEIICSDAAQYPVPDEPAIFFFNNPFAYEIMELVLDNIVSSYLRLPRQIYLIFYRASSVMPNVSKFLPAKTGGHARRRVSATLASGTINIFELPDWQG